MAGNNFCFIAAIKCSFLGVNALIAIPQPMASGLQTAGIYFNVGAIKCCRETKITTPPNERHNIPLNFVFQVIFFLLKNYTTSMQYFQTMPMYIPSVVVRIDFFYIFLIYYFIAKQKLCLAASGYSNTITGLNLFQNLWTGCEIF